MMVRRTYLGVALVGWLALAGVNPAQAFENLEKGMSPDQLFKTNCAICHGKDRGLGSSMSPRALPGFLAEHYTASKATANALAGYLTSSRRDERPAPRRRASGAGQNGRRTN